VEESIPSGPEDPRERAIVTRRLASDDEGTHGQAVSRDGLGPTAPRTEGSRFL